MCSYVPAGDRQCSRANVVTTNHCPLHSGWDRPPDVRYPNSPGFQLEFDKLLAAKDGDWRGFVFPRGFSFPKLIDFRIRAAGCQTHSLDIADTVFKEDADFTDATFLGGTVLRSVVFETNVIFDRARFLGTVDFLNVKFHGNASFHRAEFSARAILRANFAKHANLNEVVFQDAVTIAGWRNVTAQLSGTLSLSGSATGTLTGGAPPTFWQRTRALLLEARNRMALATKRTKEKWKLARTYIQQRYRAVRRRFATSDPNTRQFEVFEGDGQLQNAIFMKPEYTVFSQVNLANVYLRGTNLRGVRFLGVTWWQPGLRRNGLRDELFVYESADGPFQYRELPVLQEACREVRLALEDGRQFNVASDFYIAEMEALRKRMPFPARHFFSIPALYGLVSRYGTSVARAFAVLAILFMLHIFTSLCLQFGHSEEPLLKLIGDAPLRSLRLIVFQSVDGGVDPAGPQAWLDTIFRILGLIQVTMLVFAFRARIKRH